MAMRRFNLVVVTDLSVLEKYSKILKMGKLQDLNEIVESIKSTFPDKTVPNFKIRRALQDFMLNRGEIGEDTTFYLVVPQTEMHRLLSARDNRPELWPSGAEYVADEVAYLSDDVVTILTRCETGWFDVLKETGVRIQG